MFFTRTFTLIMFLIIAGFIFSQMVLPAFIPNLRFFWIFKRDQKLLHKLSDAKTEAENYREAKVIATQVREILPGEETDDDVLKFEEK